MKKLLFVLLAGILGLPVIAQPVEKMDAGSKKRDLNGSFHAIQITDGITLVLTEGKEESLAVSFAEEKFEEKFKTVVEDGVLRIYYDNNGVNYSSNSRRKLKAYVTFKNLDKITASGGASVDLPAGMSAKEMDMKFTSGATFEGKINANALSVDLQSGAVINMEGKAEKIDIVASSGAIYKGYGFSTNYCDAKASSGASVRVLVEKELNAQASSGGGINYKGAAVIKDISINLGGIVKKA